MQPCQCCIGERWRKAEKPPVSLSGLTTTKRDTEGKYPIRRSQYYLIVRVQSVAAVYLTHPHPM